jgi:hypothetical protein
MAKRRYLYSLTGVKSDRQRDLVRPLPHLLHAIAVVAVDVYVHNRAEAEQFEYPEHDIVDVTETVSAIWYRPPQQSLASHMHS